MKKLNQLAIKRLCFASLALIIALLLSTTTYAQNYNAPDYSKINKKRNHSYYKKNESRLLHACGLLNKKRHYTPRKSFLASNRKPKANVSTERSVLHIDKSDVTADISSIKPVVKPVVKPIEKEPKIEHISEEKLEILHKKEEEVLVTNNLPVPTSQKQQEVRKIVGDKLASKTNVYPLTLAPLYFQFNQDEFSVVDMEPFLVAAEYALQGRTVLIEGHTDSRGKDDFNVKLSIKRVQKIRQLMLDMGVPDERISIVGYGEELNETKTKTEDGHQLNRKVAFTVF